MKVVADTMLWVSYFTAKKGYRHRLIDFAHALRVRFYFSEYIAEELVRTLTTDFEASPRELRAALRVLNRLARVVALRLQKSGWVLGAS